MMTWNSIVDYAGRALLNKDRMRFERAAYALSLKFPQLANTYKFETIMVNIMHDVKDEDRIGFLVFCS